MGADETVAAAAYRRSRPAKRMASGVVVRDGDGRLLLVEPTYKATWDLPGGCVEADESPRDACEREVLEELGLPIEVGRLLCIEWQAPEPDRSESLMLVYDGGLWRDDPEVRLKSDELKSYDFVTPDELDQLASLRVARRARAALEALRAGSVVELDSGQRVATSPNWS